MLKKILWFIAGFVSLKLTNEIGYTLLNIPGEGVILWKAYLAPLPGLIPLAFCLLKGDVFFEYSKKIGTKKLKQIYKILLVSFAVSMSFMVIYFFSNLTSAPPKIFSSAKSVSIFSCDSYNDASSCAGNCKKINQLQFDFKIDKARNIVIKTAFENNKLLQQKALENCVVVDEGNWICKDTMVRDKFYSEVRESMNNGKYYFFSANAIEGGHSSFYCTR